MKPAQQRSVGPIMAKLARSVPSGEKENVPDADTHGIEPSRPPSRPSSRTGTKKPEQTMNKPSRVTNEKRQATPMGQKPRSPRSEAPVHPLIPLAGPPGQDKSRSALRSMTWPEYPEEPLGSDIFNQLKLSIPDNFQNKKQHFASCCGELKCSLYSCFVSFAQ